MATQGVRGNVYSFFDSYQYLWSPQRPQRTTDEIERLCQHIDTPVEDGIISLSFDDRVAMRSLFYTVVDDTNLRNVLDGLLLPPPYYLADFSRKHWTEEDVRALCSVLHPTLDWVLVNLPFNLALRLGSYDARLRAAARRFCWIFSIPFSLLERKEISLAQMRMSASGSGAAAVENVEKQEMVLHSKTYRKRSLKRVATIGGFSLIGGVALVVTGGLVAPIVGPAYAALVTATATTLGTLGAVGGAVLGPGALATIFASIVGAATHAAALASIITPTLTAANLTAIFGVTGASLGGYRAFRRTMDSGIFMLRSINEVETFELGAAPTASVFAAAKEEEVELNEKVVRRLASSHQSVESCTDAADSAWHLSGVLEEDSKPGVVVPRHTRVVAMSHAKNIPSIQKRRRHVVFAVENNLMGYELRLKAIKLISGVWVMAPPAVIAPAQAGVFACVNRFAHPTGAGFIVCYVATPSPGTVNATSLRVWVRTEQDFCGTWVASAVCEKVEMEFNPTVAEYWLEHHTTTTTTTRRQHGVALELHVAPYTYLKLYSASAGETLQARTVTFPSEELPQRQLEYGHAVTQRRKLGVSLVNRSSHTVLMCDMGMVNGQQWSGTASPVSVYPAEASLTYFTSSEWSLAGAEGYYIVEVVNSYSAPVTPRYYVRLQFEVSSLNKVNVAFATAYNLTELTHHTLTPASPSSAEFPVELPPGLFFSLTCVVDVALHTVQLVFQDFVERLDCARALDTEKMTLAIGVSGYSAIFDPRRPLRDQQVGLWQSVLRRSELLGSAEPYVLQWEDEYLVKFGDVIHVNLDIADNLAKKTVGTATATAKKTLLQGTLFTGLPAFPAFSSLVGSFQLPLFAVWATGVIDNSFATLSNRAAYTGKDLAVALLHKQRGNRPVTLIGFSFGSQVIVESLLELHKVGAYDIVENVYLLGSTCSSDPVLWQRLRRVVAGRLINVYTREDWTLWMMYRLNRTDLRPMAGINPVHVPGVENVDVTPLVSAHGDYAAKLLPVLESIPQQPTATTWNPRQHNGSPGVTVPVRKCRETVVAVSKSLHSFLTVTPYAAVGVKNCVVSDLSHYEPKIELISVQLYGCFFDYMPPPLTDTGMASVAGLLGDTDAPIGVVVAYRMRLPASAPRDLLVVVYLCRSPGEDVQAFAQPHLVKRHSSPTETAEQAHQRLCTITAEGCQSLDALQRICRALPNESKLRRDTVHIQSIPLRLPNVFTDNHQTATVRLVLERLDPSSITITWLALMTKGSTPLQRETFDEAQFKSTMAVISTLRPHHHGGSTWMRLPVVADTCSTDDMTQGLRALAAQLQDPDQYPANIASFVLVNCGTSPLYFSEAFYNPTKTAAMAQLVNHAPVPDTPSYAWPNSQWIRFPPPEIPPKSFAVAMLTVHAGEAGANCAVRPIRYETHNGQCAFDLEFAANIFPTGGAEEGFQASPPAHCTPVEGKPHLGDVSLSHTTIQSTPFVIIMITPRTDAEADARVEDARDTVESRLQARGWFLM
ncbi:hypothetical protein JKF63_06494 [Porcisia hertigi]|uniref:Transmembrane protein n=1 Tax=Porcisia hertigi TaxID=2761500 RepID=A0A836LG78_9TRYP|nr:hypothetical protein JKF63_06494 [Porcisia hertigi]